MRGKICRCILLTMVVSIVSGMCVMGCSSVDKRQTKEDGQNGTVTAVNTNQGPSIASIAQASVPELGLGDLQLAGIKVYDPEDRVRGVLGKPDRIEEIKEEELGQEGVKLYYSGLIVELFNDPGVSRITTYSPQYATVRGLKVGDSLERVYELYGNPRLDQDGEIYYCFGRDDFDVFMVTIEDGQVSSISVYLGC